jgi:hypothetical protein
MPSFTASGDDNYEVNIDNSSFDEEQFHKNLDKIKDSYYILSNEDEEIIKQIANKL